MEFTGGFRQSTSSLQEAIPRDISQATDLAGRNGAATFDADSRGAPNCFVRAGRELVRNVSGGGKGGTKIQTSPPKRISPPTRTAERPVMALTVKLRGRTHAPDQRRGRTISSGAPGT